MMFLGFGAMGLASRRTRERAALAQITVSDCQKWVPLRETAAAFLLCDRRPLFGRWRREASGGVNLF
jgi:hypothetical protein